MRSVLAGLLVACAALALLAGTAAAGKKKPSPSPAPQFPALSYTWSHVDINVKIAGQPHTLILDKGRIQQVSSVQVTLVEADGSVVTVPLSPTTIVTWSGIGVSSRVLRKGLTAETMRIDAGAAVRIRLSLRP